MNVAMSLTCRNVRHLLHKSHNMVRWMSGRSGNFFQQLMNNVKQEFTKNKEMKESLRKFREETQKLEQSDALKKARQKFESIEAETASVRRTLGDIKDKMSETVEELQKTEFIKKGQELGLEIGKTAGRAADSITRSGEQLSNTAAYKSVSQGVRVVKQEFDDVTLARAKIYKSPEKLKKRSELAKVIRKDRPISVNEDATGMVLHKDFRFMKSWQDFKDNNQYIAKMFDLRMRYDESDHVLVRASRVVTDKVGQLFGGVFTNTEMSDVLTEICKVDPAFNKHQFITLCEKEIIPNVLEAIVHGDTEVLRDWCYEATYNTLAQPIKQALAARYRLHSRVLDVSNVDVMAGKMMEQGPVLVINFHAQQIMAVKDSKGLVVEGDENKTVRVVYVWALCRDQDEMDPLAAWKLLDLSANASDQWL